MCRARDPHFQPWISVPEHIIFTNFQKSVPEHHHFTFFGGFCHFWEHYFQNFFNFNPFIASHGRLSRGLARRVLAVLETRIFTLKTDQAPSGAPHFQAQNGSSSFRSPAFSCSTGSSFRSPCPFIVHFAAPHTYQNLGWVPPPPPPPPRDF